MIGMLLDTTAWEISGMRVSGLWLDLFLLRRMLVLGLLYIDGMMMMMLEGMVHRMIRVDHRRMINAI